MQSCVQFTERKFKDDIYKWEDRKSDKLVYEPKNTTINNIRYDLNTATASNTQANIASDSDTDNQNSNRIFGQNNIELLDH